MKQRASYFKTFIRLLTKCVYFCDVTLNRIQLDDTQQAKMLNKCLSFFPSLIQRSHLVSNPCIVGVDRTIRFRIGIT